MKVNTDIRRRGR